MAEQQKQDVNVDWVVKMHSNVVIGKENCGFCEKAVRLLDRNQVQYKYIDWSECRELVEKIKREQNHTTFPKVFLDGKAAQSLQGLGTCGRLCETLCKQKVLPQHAPMKVCLEEGHLRSHGFLAVFRKQQFLLEFTLPDRTHVLHLRARAGYIGYLFETNAGIVIFNARIKSRVVESAVIDLEKDGRIELRNTFFSGYISLRRLGRSMFVELENRFLIKRGMSETTFFSTKVNDMSGHAIRELYNGTTYSVDVHRDFVKLVSRETYKERLPYGWEERKIGGNKRFYIDHNNRITQWANPNVERKNFGEALEKVVDSFDSINIFSPFRNSIVLEIKRKFAIQSSYAKIIESAHILRNVEVKIKFEDEIGGDGGGLLREYFDLVSAELAQDPRLEDDNGIYDIGHFDVGGGPGGAEEHGAGDECEHTNRAPNRDFLFYLGVILGLSIRNSSPLKIVFSLCFFENLLKREYSLRKVQDVAYQSSLLQVLRGKEDFSEALGADLSTERKRQRYVQDTLYQRYFLSKKEQYEVIYRGFYSIAPHNLSSICTSYMLSALAAGPRCVNVQDLQACTVYINCHADTKEVVFLWRILGEGGPACVHMFLRFSTGSATVPTGQMLNNRFRLTIEQQCSRNMLFRSSTCISRLWIGTYDTIDDMARIFDTCMNETEGFHVV
ncbi:UNVERIFIED_CONTAM: hypothetical protein PYX00_011639 [Menopon gallinae]|uniref:HECT-type E3 ubiquitin transferase n=1 Tax=Menopon gallinae TaxID=328185 RepID=A0AAW2H800_9NEOP